MPVKGIGVRLKKVNANSVSALGNLGGTVERWVGGERQCTIR
jgi:hypothetical protein